MNFLQFGLHYMPILLQGVVITLEITVLGILFGLALGVLAALGRISSFMPFQSIARLYTWVIRGTPLLVQLFLAYYGLPQIHVDLAPKVAAILVLAINSGAYIAEIVRAGIQSIDTGQMEAAESLGMTHALAMRRIIFPQAYRRLLPPLVNEFVALLKDSSLVSTIALTDLLRRGQEIYASTFRPMDTLIWVGILYLIMTTVFVFIASRLERRLEVKG
jgi:His/Glu/Gln/Arg/opine family amino acid ABC transporter permease subunit